MLSGRIAFVSHVQSNRLLMLMSTVAAMSPFVRPESAAAGTGGAWVEFADETSTRLVVIPSLGVSDPDEKEYAWADIDKDGDIDLVCVRKEPWTSPGRRRNVLFMNEGVADGHAINGVLVDRTNQYATSADDGGQGFLDLTNDRDVALVDVNNDTWLDMVTATTISDGLPKTISHPRVYRNLGNNGNGDWLGFRYEQARIPQLLTIPGGSAVAPRFCSVAGKDLTGDGFADLYFGDYDSSGAGGDQEPSQIDLNDRLLINNGAGFFTDSAYTRMSQAMLVSAFSMAVAIEDMNGDGFVDIVKDTALNVPQRVSIAYNNPANQGFFDVFDSGVYTLAPYHTTVGDLNNDSRLDLVITDDGSDRYLLNTGNGAQNQALFSSRTFSFQTGGDDGFGGDSVIADLNKDGFKDVLITDVDIDISGCDRRLHIYRNLGNLPTVTLQEQLSGGTPEPWMPNGAHDVAVFDLNGDNWLDMVIGTCNGTEVWINQPPTDLQFAYPDGLPADIVPDQITQFDTVVSGTGSVPQPGTGRIFISVDGAPFTDSAMPQSAPNEYVAMLPAVPCTSTVRYYFSAETTDPITITDPRGAPLTTYFAVANVGSETVIDEKFEAPDPGWTVSDQNVLTGAWVRVDPVGSFFPDGSTTPAQPGDDFGAATDETMCWVTGQHSGGAAGLTDLDGGPTILTSPIIDVAGVDAIISYARWQYSSVGGASILDELITEITNNGGDWVRVDGVFNTGSAWNVHSFKISDYVPPTATVQVRFVASDQPNNSITESAIDNFTVTKLLCEFTCTIDGDCDDGLYCNGAESCVEGECLSAPPPCPQQFCDDVTDACSLILQPRMGDPLAGLTAGQLDRFNQGSTRFNQTLSIPNGLGPIFNQNSCAACHNGSGAGGAGSILVTRFGFADKNGFDPLASLGGSLLQSQAISGTCSEQVPVESNIAANRVTPSVFGDGLVESVDDADILAGESSPPPGITGAAHMVPALEDPPASPLRVGRFGWKAQVPTMLTFSGDAALNEMGLTNRLVPTENAPNGDMGLLAICDTIPDPEDGPDAEGLHFIDRVTDFQRLLAAPPQTPKSGMTGEAVFNSIGCAGCHVPSFITGVVAESSLSSKTIKPYSDFLLHDMGQLGDGIVQGDAGTTEMRTPPLWGVRARDPVLHDGRVAGGSFDERIRDAISWHDALGGEAQPAGAAFDALPEGDKLAVIAFLDSLGRAEFDHDGNDSVLLPDFLAFRGCFDGPGGYSPDDACAISDIDQDGDVDLTDAAMFVDAWDGPLTDCNNNAAVDLLDILTGFSQDLDNNAIPDSCTPPCIDAATCGDGNVCTADLCTGGFCDNPPALYGDVNNTGDVDIFDILCVLDGFAGNFTDCVASAVDIAPCTPDGLHDIFDILAVLDAFSGTDTCCGGP
ncbi:MAG: hypothetical protein HOP29_16965 [Phycisphaerales bacterium]|nr:hypothetical protein [Phycisphaerales bacterium]